MCADPYAAEQRQRQRQAALQRRQQSQREDLRHAACTLIPDHGLSVSLGQLAAQVGLSRHAAAGLYPGVADLAVDLVCRSFRALIETTAPRPGDTPENVCARLIQALRTEAAAQRVWQAIHCGLPPRHRETLAHEETFLAFAMGEALREIRPAPVEASAEIGGQVLALARHAADAAARDLQAEAARIAAILPLLAPAPEAAPPALESPAQPDVSPPRERTRPAAPAPAAVPRPPAPPALGQPALPRLPILPAQPPPWAMPARHGRDPPARAA